MGISFFSAWAREDDKADWFITVVSESLQTYSLLNCKIFSGRGKLWTKTIKNNSGLTIQLSSISLCTDHLDCIAANELTFLPLGAVCELTDLVIANYQIQTVWRCTFFTWASLPVPFLAAVHYSLMLCGPRYVRPVSLGSLKYFLLWSLYRKLRKC